MARYVAFLRAVNLGSVRKVPMDRLRKEIEALGYDDVSTYIASGNVIFSTPGKAASVERAIEERLIEAFGFEVPTMVRTVKQVVGALELEPFGPVNTAKNKWTITFLRKAPPAAVRKAVEGLSNDKDDLQVHGADLHWLVHGPTFAESGLKPTAIDRALGAIAGTNRNTTMLRKLVDRA